MKTIKFSKPTEASMPKKTIKVDQLILKANFQLIRTDKTASADYKQGICQSIESVLHATGNYNGFQFATGNYNGFQFLNNDDCEHGTVGYWSRCYSMPHWSVY
jgi:hypothetical protein